MLSITLSEVSETITLNQTEVKVYPLPLYFGDRIHLVWPAPPMGADDKITPARTVYLMELSAVEAVEALRQSERIQYEVRATEEQTDGEGSFCTNTKSSGRPAWDDSAAWPAYAQACAQAVENAGFTHTHIKAIRDALQRLEGKQLEALKEVGND